MDGKVTPKGLKVGMAVWVVVVDGGPEIRPANRKDMKTRCATTVSEQPGTVGSKWSVTTGMGTMLVGASQWFTLVDTDVPTAAPSVAETIESDGETHEEFIPEQYTIIAVHGGEIHALAEGTIAPLCETPLRRYTTVCVTDRLEFGHGVCHLCAERTQIL